LVRGKNVLSTMMHSFIVIGLVSVIWVTIGYSLAFGPDAGDLGIIGNLDWFGLKDVGQTPSDIYATTIPHQVFMAFQMMFAIITPALITGAFAERAKFSTFLVFMAVWSIVVYAPVAHWVWAFDFNDAGEVVASGWLGERGALDFAGGTVVHVNAGIAALAAALLYGRRMGYGKEPMEPHNIPFVVLGAGLLWFGWFGFNAGSAVASNGLAGNAFVVTHVATAAAALTWVAWSWALTGKPSVVGAAAGAVAGLVAITPASGFVDAMPALAIGAGAGTLCYLAVRLRVMVGLDDSLDVVGVHGVGGAWGALATGIFAATAVNPLGSGLIDGNGSQVGEQLLAIGATMAYSFIVTLVILKVLDLVMGLRVSDDEEQVGVDVSQHGERGYVFDGAPSYVGIPTTQMMESSTPPSGQGQVRPAPASPSGGGL
jgi:Amt family ammonium transporter